EQEQIERKGEYNQLVVPESIEDYVEDGVLSEGFDVDQELTGDYDTTAHYGVDGIRNPAITNASGDLRTPWYTSVKSVDPAGSNPFVLTVLGTDIRIRVKHSDVDDLPSVRSQYKPGQTISVFPESNNSNVPSSSTGPHNHIEVSRGGQFGWQRYLVNPIGLTTSETDFQFTTDGWETSNPANTYF
ncbi:MAG: hypothetical protein JEY91_08320, partial [Spirochaetaceae bacterium]|nr:hypothetical protein [Spirochaetaceae bacterium]